MHNNVSCRTKAVFSRCSEPMKKQESHEVKEDGNCCCHLQRKGFAEIVKSKRCCRMTIKLLVFFLCTSGFLYHTCTFLQMYLAYPTTLDTSEEYPDSFIAPAITICNMNRIRRQPYCKTYPEKCTWQHTTWETFCAVYRRMCPKTKPPDFNFGIPVFERFMEKNRSNAFLEALGPQNGLYMLDDCMHFRKQFSEFCNTTVIIRQVSRNGFPYTCVSIFSLVGKHNDERNLTLSDRFLIVLEMHPEDYFDNTELVQAAVVVHDPRKVVNPMTEGIILTSGKFYELFPTMERRESLPPPYASNCMDYLKEWEENGYGPLSRDDCINQCKMRVIYSKYGCVGQTLTIPNRYEICPSIRFDVSYEETKRCASSCRVACEENIYHVTSDTVYHIQASCDPTDEYCKSQYLYIRLSFKRMKMKKLKQIPRIESIELFSYIGGYLGIWLGISLASVFDLAEMIYDVIDKAFLKRKKNQKTI